MRRVCVQSFVDSDLCFINPFVYSHRPTNKKNLAQSSITLLYNEARNAVNMAAIFVEVLENGVNKMRITFFVR